MEYFAGLDISMEETHVCLLDRDGVITHQAKVASTPAHCFCPKPPSDPQDRKSL